MVVNISSRASQSLPDGSRLRALEVKSRHKGSGLEWEALIGDWRVEYVWNKESTHPSPVAGSLLRAMEATLQIQSYEDRQLVLCNSIKLGFFKLSFHGPGRLEHRRPLLTFHFDRLIISFAGQTLFSLGLPKPAANREPFFALIASSRLDAGGRWLAARGRGGGLALWVERSDSLA